MDNRTLAVWLRETADLVARCEQVAVTQMRMLADPSISPSGGGAGQSGVHSDPTAAAVLRPQVYEAGLYLRWRKACSRLRLLAAVHGQHGLTRPADQWRSIADRLDNGTVDRQIHVTLEREAKDMQAIIHAATPMTAEQAQKILNDEARVAVENEPEPCEACDSPLQAGQVRKGLCEGCAKLRGRMQKFRYGGDVSNAEVRDRILSDLARGCARRPNSPHSPGALV